MFKEEDATRIPARCCEKLMEGHLKHLNQVKEFEGSYYKH